MSDDFGSEFVDVIENMRARGFPIDGFDIPAGPGVDLRDYLIFRFGVGSVPPGSGLQGLILYFPPGRYMVSFRERGPNSFTIPSNVQLFFASGALLRPEASVDPAIDGRVDLIIDGSIRAGLQQIFGYERGRALPRGIAVPDPAPPRTNTAPLGRIILTSSLIPEVYPEWWGAAFNPDPPSVDPVDRTFDNSDALQAAIDAACVLRDYPEGRVLRPAIPLVLSARYQCNRTLTVNCPDGSPNLHFVMRGSASLAPVYGRGQSIVRVLRAHQDPAGECALRIGPRVSFDIQDVGFDMPASSAAVEGCVDILSDRVGTAFDDLPRRGLFRRCSITSGLVYGLRVQGGRNASLRHVLVDSCSVMPQNVTYLTERAVDVSGDPSLMLHIDGTLMSTGQLGAGDPLPPTSATIHQRGASVLVRATQFHGGTGPRPSPAEGTRDAEGEPIDLTKPDGQEIFLEELEGSSLASASHFTALHCESQGWWFLSRPRAGDEQVVLLNITHENVNWSVANLVRFTRRGGGEVTADTVFGQPPSVVWLGARGQCVFVACRFDHSVLVDAGSWNSIVNVATFFKRPFVNPVDIHDPHYRVGPDGNSENVGYPENFRRYLAVNSIIRPPFYTPLYLDDPVSNAYDNHIDHAVPIRRFPA